MIDQSYLNTQTNTLTVLVTYTCTAACKECCFGCTPKMGGRLSREQICSAIDEAKRDFPGLQLVVFSGGECFLLKEDLYEAIAFASNLGLKTRCVTNAFWGKTAATARRTVAMLVRSGITEINISTGNDHQEFVPSESVINAAEALVKEGVPTLITIEQETEQSSCRTVLFGSSKFQKLLEDTSGKLRVQTNTWMPFTHSPEPRERAKLKVNVTGPCSQIFSNVVITPHHMLSACCGLTLEHIPEMKLGYVEPGSIRRTYAQQLDDFLKIWLHVEGPSGVLESVLPSAEADALIRDSNHICQLCAVLHLTPDIRKAIQSKWRENVPRVLRKLAAQRLANQVYMLDVETII